MSMILKLEEAGWRTIEGLSDGVEAGRDVALMVMMRFELRSCKLSFSAFPFGD